MGGPCVVVLHGAIGNPGHPGERAFEGEFGAEGLPQYLQHPSGANVPVKRSQGRSSPCGRTLLTRLREEALTLWCELTCELMPEPRGGGAGAGPRSRSASSDSHRPYSRRTGGQGPVCNWTCRVGA